MSYGLNNPELTPGDRGIEMTDQEAIDCHNLLVKYASMESFINDWSITERNVFRDLAADLSESVGSVGCLSWPDVN
jgi:hypothetical protein